MMEANEITNLIELADWLDDRGFDTLQTIKYIESTVGPEIVKIIIKVVTDKVSAGN